MHQIQNASAGNSCSCSALPTKPAQVSSVQDLYEFICSGPLPGKLSLTPERTADSIDKWIAYNSYLCQLFQLNELYLTVPQKARFYHYYIHVFIWCENQISQHMSEFKDGEDIPPLLIGFSAPQGLGMIKGDRADPSTWQEVEGPLMVGCLVSNLFRWKLLNLSTHRLGL
ncbi:hypothetical protein LWI29_007586 [Acer saccharum]|uniref:Uncharacterized protein n=1 Tax=Acer saccharum TaxID=4024 RepID=A0AA39SLU5_ACESA|nr:hypothetical protein LWI29_007586 [Acer saccharum]